MEMVVIIRPSFKRFCGDDACRAALFNHLLYWIAQKCKGQPVDKIKKGELCWYGSVEEEICTGMDHSWSIWKIRKELDALSKGPGALIGKRHNPVKGWDREYQYFIGEEQGQAIRDACKQHGVDLLSLKLDADVIHLLKTVNAVAENSESIQRKQQMDLSKTADPSAENSGAIPKVTAKDTSKDTAKKEETPTAQPVSSDFSEVEEEFLSWLKEKRIYWKEKDVETVKQQIAFVRDAISTKEQLHRYCDHATRHYQGQKNSKVWLGNLAKQWLLDGFLQTEQAMQPFTAPSSIDVASQSDIEALAAEIQATYPELVLRAGTDDYGPFIDVLYGDGEYDCEIVRDGEDWSRVCNSQEVLEQVLTYGKQHSLVA